MHWTKAAYILCIFILVFEVSCKSDSKQSSGKIELDNRIGDWNIIKATKNGEATSLLENGFINFESESLSHNLTGDTVKVSYTIDGYNITANDDVLKNATFQKLKNDTAVIRTKYGKFDFEFILVKK